MGGGTRPSVGRLSATIQLARAADLLEVAQLETVCYTDPWPAASFESLPQNDRVFFAVARTEDGLIAGYAVAWYVLDEGELANLAVRPDLRRKGLGRALLGAVLADSERRGIQRLFLEVRASNVAAAALYRSCDFVEVGRRRDYYRSPVEDALILRRTFRRGFE